jgi:hypothetical protein
MEEFLVEQSDKNPDGKNHPENMKHHEKPDSFHQNEEMKQVELEKQDSTGNVNTHQKIKKVEGKGKGKKNLDEISINENESIKPEEFSKWLEDPKITSKIINDKNLSEYTHKFKSKIDEVLIKKVWLETLDTKKI